MYPRRQRHQEVTGTRRAFWTAATCRRFQSADVSAHSKFPALLLLDKFLSLEQCRITTRMKILSTTVRLLTFRSGEEELQALNYRHLIFGLICTWLVGVGRWWEDPNASFLQHLGIGSVIYVFVLTFFLWLVLWPLTPPHWSFLNILIFVTLTAPPAILYAIPVRHGLALQTAQTVRLWFLAIVAGWRVALLTFYLRRGTGLDGFRWVLATLFPLLFIVFTLTVLNLEKVIFNIMSGIRESDRTVNDTAYGMLFSLSLFSMVAFLPLLAAYLVCSVKSVIAKYGRHWVRFFYILALALVASGIALSFANLSFLGIVLMGSGFVIALTARLNLHVRQNP